MDISASKHYSKLARDYITAFHSSPVKDFFPIPPDVRSTEFVQLLAARAQRAASPEEKTKRLQLVRTLREQHTKAGSLTPAVEANLTLLGSDRCLAVVTGQQVGILGGPLYTIYKAFHTIILTDELRKLYPEYSFVPVFWQETEDHDFEETSFVNIISANFELKTVHYTPHEDISRRQIGGLKFGGDALATFFSEIEGSLPKTDFSEAVIETYKKAYRAELTFSESQAIILGTLLANEGLLVLDPNTRELKGQAAHIFKKEIETAPYLSDAIKEISTGITSYGYHAQLDPQGMNLFFADAGRRYKLSKVGDAYSYNSIVISSKDILSVVKDAPEKFSMNVVMRPLVQDTILPTVAYIAGPGEIAYFTQLKPAYDWAGMSMPLILPRIGMTMLEDRYAKLLSKYNSTPEAFIENSSQIIAQLLASEQETVLAEAFAKSSAEIDAAIEFMRPAVSSTDATLDQALTTLKGKLLSAVKDFEGKSLAAERKKQSGTKQQFDKALNVLLPEGKLQERELNLLYFLNKYGFAFWEKLKSRLLKNPISTGEHHIIALSEILGDN